MPMDVIKEKVFKDTHRTIFARVKLHHADDNGGANKTKPTTTTIKLSLIGTLVTLSSPLRTMSGTESNVEGGSLLLNQPVVIDNGSSTIKAGFAGSSKPKVRRSCRVP